MVDILLKGFFIELGWDRVAHVESHFLLSVYHRSGIDRVPPNELNQYIYVGNDPLDRNDPTGNGPDMFYSSADMAAMGQMAQVRAVQDEARAEALSYPNRQVALTSVAAASAAGTFTPLAPAAGPLSVLATVAALTDKVITTGKVEVTDLLLSILPAFKLAKAASALTGIAEIGSTVKTGQEALHAGAAAMGAAAAVIEKKEGEGQRPVTAKPQPKVPGNQSPPTPGPWASCARGIPSTC